MSFLGTCPFLCELRSKRGLGDDALFDEQLCRRVGQNSQLTSAPSLSHAAKRYQAAQKEPEVRRESSLRATGMAQSVLLYSLLFAPCALQAGTLQRGD